MEKTTHNAKETLGERLRRLRTKRRLSVQEMAALISISVSTYREWKAGRAIQGEPYAQIASALSVGLHELLTGDKGDRGRALDLLSEVERSITELRKELQSFF